jgi:ABC-type Fe3+-hydroxamate transport system substrate-binding protein
MAPRNALLRKVSLRVALGLALAATAVGISPAAEKPAQNTAKTKYLRVIHDAQDRTIGLETAIVSFGPATAGTMYPCGLSI